MSDTTVLIVGAGPTGLTLAGELARHGTDCLVIEKHPDVLEATKAAALHARALEFLDDLGIADRILEEGQRVDLLRLRTGYRDRIGVDFRTLSDTKFPHMVDIPQSRTEQLLLEHLDAADSVEVRRGATLTSLSDGGDHVVAEVETSGGVEHITAEWVVGCDGVRSTVRDLIGQAFKGDEYADDWVLCDAEVDWPLPRNEMTFSGDREGIYGVFPLPGKRTYRLAYTQSTDEQGNLIEPDIEDAQTAMRRTGIDGTITSVRQFWTFNLAHRQATAFRDGRVFLAGDAGHVHTPFGGQGLNLGVGDAANLAWKLAEVAAGRAPESFLASYHDERHAVATSVVRFTHIGASAMLLRGDPRRHLRDAAFAVMQSSTRGRRKMARRLSQLAHTYAGTSYVTGRGNGLEAGDRWPDLPIYDGIGQGPVRLHELCGPDHYTLVVAGPTAAALDHAGRLAAELDERWSIRFSTVVLSPDWRLTRLTDGRQRAVLDRGRDAASLYAHGDTAYLVRPDRHVGYVGSAADPGIHAHLRLVALRTHGETSPLAEPLAIPSTTE